MTWLLSQGEHLPVILGAIVVSFVIARYLFTTKAEMAAIRAQIDDLRKADDQHMSSVTRAHGRIDEWSKAVHEDMVRLFDRADKRMNNDHNGST